MTKYATLSGARVSLALLAALVLSWTYLARSRVTASDKRDRARDAALAAVGILSLLVWPNYGVFRSGSILHYADIFHYYVGAKYFRELRYTELYHCAGAADIEAGLAPLGGSAWLRRLSTNDLERMDDARPLMATCRARFSAARWNEFVHDVGWFRERIGPKRWPLMFNDHGYNAPPTWTLVGGTLANLAPVSSTQVSLLAAIDPVLILLLLGAIWRTFGWRPTAVAVIWMGLSHPTRFYWIGGSVIRWDWMAMTVIAVCLAYRKHFFLSGLSLGYAALVRIFPAFLLGALVVRQLWNMRVGREWRALSRTVAGFVAAVAVVVPLTGVVVGTGAIDLTAWKEFRDDNLLQVRSPTIAKVGMRTLFAFEPETRLALMRDAYLDAPWDTWRYARRRVFATREPYFWCAVAAYLILFAGVMRRSDPWEAMALGAGLVPILIEAAAYYQIILMLFGLLWMRDRRIGIFLAVAAALTTAAPATTDWDDVLHATISAVVVGLAVVTTIVFSLRASSTSQPSVAAS